MTYTKPVWLCSAVLLSQSEYNVSRYFSSEASHCPAKHYFDCCTVDKVCWNKDVVILPIKPSCSSPSGGGGAREGGRGWWGEGGEERFSVVWPVRGCAGCWVGNGFCHLTPKQEYTILRESFPNKGSYNFVQSKAAHLYPKPPPLWDAPDSRRDDDDVTQCFNFLHKHSAYQMCNN